MTINKYWETSKKKKRHNKTYRKVLTKHNKRLRDKRILMYMLAWFVITATYAFIDISNNFVISCDEVVSFSTLETTPIATPEQGELTSSTPPELVISAVMIETEKSNEMQIRSIAKEFGFKWENYLVNLACCEGLLKTDTINDKGNYPVGSRDRGLYGINDYWHIEVSDFTAHNLRLSTIWTMNHINNGKQHEFICDKRIRGVENFYLRCLSIKIIK